MKGDLRIKLTISRLGEKEPLVAMDGTSDNPEAVIFAAREVINQAERLLAAEGDGVDA